MLDRPSGRGSRQFPLRGIKGRHHLVEDFALCLQVGIHIGRNTQGAASRWMMTGSLLRIITCAYVANLLLGCPREARLEAVARHRYRPGGAHRIIPGSDHQADELRLEAPARIIRWDQVTSDVEEHRPVYAEPHVMGGEHGIFWLEAPGGWASVREVNDGGQGVPAVLTVFLGEREARER